MIPVSCWCFILLLLLSKAIALDTSKLHYLQKSSSISQQSSPASSSSAADDDKGTKIPESSNVPHSRQKRLIWVTDDGRLALPPGTSLVIAPTLAMPLVRYPPDGFHSNLSISVPLTIDFDKLGLTDNQNPLGTLGPLFARSFSASAGSVLADYVFKYLKHRSKRDISSGFNDFIKVHRHHEEENEIPRLPDEHQHAFHGGERALLYAVLEDLLTQFGLDGHNCLLRAICEVHSKNVHRFGLFGEFLKLFLTASLSPYSDLLTDYVKAEQMGKEVSECLPYYKKCPKSIFKSASSSFNSLKQPPTSSSSSSSSVTFNHSGHESM